MLRVLGSWRITVLLGLVLAATAMWLHTRSSPQPWPLPNTAVMNSTLSSNLQPSESIPPPDGSSSGQDNGQTAAAQAHAKPVSYEDSAAPAAKAKPAVQLAQPPKAPELEPVTVDTQAIVQTGLPPICAKVNLLDMAKTSVCLKS
jgi:hypothetical protein